MTKLNGTWIDSEEVQTDYGQFRRRGLVIHSRTKELVKVRMDMADTVFSIPATTDTEHGYVTTFVHGDNAELEDFEFRPHTEQTQTPAEYRRSMRRAYK